MSARPEVATAAADPAATWRGSPTFRWAVVAVACVFGPYVVGGLRTEQLALYGSAAVAVVLLRRHLGALRPGWPVLAAWAVYAGTAAVAAFVVDSELGWGTGSLVAGLDNAFLPLATMTAVALWGSALPREALLRAVCWVVVVGMSVNAALALLTSYVGFDGVPLLPRFWAAGGSGTTVAELAAGSGRYSGLFNQPAEAGVAYSLAVFCLVFLVRTGTRAPRWSWLVAWALLILGGLLTLSKIFIVVGVLLTAWLVLTGRAHRVVLTVTAIGTVLASGVLGVAGWLGSWGASVQLQWYVDSVRYGDSLSYTLSAGRFGTAGDGHPPAPPPEPKATEGGEGVPEEFQVPGGLVEVAREVVQHHPWFGVGARGLPVSYDSTWLEAVIVAGVVGVLCLLAVHVLLLVRWIRLRHTLPREEWRLAGAVVLLALGASLGMPALTGNRESSLMWVLLSLLVVFRVVGERGRERDQEPPWR
ncbi:hypothetical protein [Nocardioides solisilvae]|uniref:hypothetical protein n=1 Tax=Nocardioides solisilvae TaxID=1542435 RepID=UPI000D74B2C1|nr:hypothetical protein [Nocardioides solisilvae]